MSIRNRNTPILSRMRMAMAGTRTPGPISTRMGIPTPILTLMSTFILTSMVAD